MMMKPTDVTCRIIVMKGTEVFRGTTVWSDGQVQYRFSPYLFDAKGFRTLQKAHRMAKRIGGYVRLFDALRGELI